MLSAHYRADLAIFQ